MVIAGLGHGRGGFGRRRPWPNSRVVVALSGQLEQTVRTFFRDVRFVGLCLPDGWFGGRAMDSYHELTFVAERPKRLLVELDEQLLLVFSGPVRVRRTTTALAMLQGTPSLLIEGFSQCVFDWLGYGNDSPHVSVFHDGRVCLVSAA